MSDGVVLILAAWVAITTIILSVFLRRLSDLFIRAFLPLLCGAVLSAAFFSPPVFPLILTSSLFITEFLSGRRFGAAGIFAGASVTILVFWGIQKSLFTGISHMGGFGFFLWTMSMVPISFALFSGIAFISQHMSGMTEEPVPESGQVPAGVTSEETGGKTGLLVLGVLVSGVFLLLLWPAFVFTFYSPLHDDNVAPGSLSLDRLDISGPPGGAIIHLTGEHITRYPVLQPLTGNSDPAGTSRSQTFGTLTINVSGIGLSRLPSCEVEKQIQAEGFTQPDTFLEYEGKYYHADIVHYAGQRC